MPRRGTFPGVFVKEVPSGSRTIEGVSTSITAFVGRAARGPVEAPIDIRNLSDFHRVFGGLSRVSELSYSVQDFFDNGGSRAIVVRLYNAAPGGNRRASIDLQGTRLEASSEGAWGNGLFVVVEASDASADAFTVSVFEREAGVDDADLDAAEVFADVTLTPGPQALADVLASGSERLRVVTTGSTLPSAGTYAVAPADEASDGEALVESDYIGGGFEANKRGLYALDKADRVNLLCLPPDFTPSGTYPGRLAEKAIDYCRRRRALFLYDPPEDWQSAADAVAGAGDLPNDPNAAFYFPRILTTDPLDDNQPRQRAPSGAIAGIYSRIDSSRGVWKAPAGTEANLRGIAGLALTLTNDENGQLNPIAINCLRTLPARGTLVWGSRTMAGHDILQNPFKYVPVKRTVMFVEESLDRGLHWAVFEPNAEPLWAQIRQSVTAFLHGSLFRLGGLQGTTPDEAFFVKCDASTTSPADVAAGRVNLVIGLALVKPAEFIVLELAQKALEP